MTLDAPPASMRIWKYTSTTPGIESHLHLHPSAPVPKPSPSQHLIRVLAVSLNPVDHKPAEAPLIGRLAVRLPATPGFDFAGRIVQPADGSALGPGTLVFGAASTNPLAGGALADYIAAPSDAVAAVPEGVSPLPAAACPVAGVTAYGTLAPHVRPGMRVFLNGGSGGVGTFAVQIAKALGAHVTVSCSGRNAELCRDLGADEVLDYTARPLLEQLREVAAARGPFEHVVDNVFSDPALYFQAHTYTVPGAKFVEVASAPSLQFVRFVLGAFLWPGFLGGGKRKFVGFISEVKTETLEKLAGWLKDGTIKPIVDRVFAMEDTVAAFKYLKTGRARGKVMVDVAGEGI